MLTTLTALEAGPRRRALSAGGALMTLCARLIAQDLLWLSRLDGTQSFALDGTYGNDHIESWDAWRRDRQQMDARIHQWATRLTRPVLEGELFWFSTLDQRAVSRPVWLCASHLFSGQTETRGQIVGHLSALGMRVEGGELIGLPHDADWM